MDFLPNIVFIVALLLSGFFAYRSFRRIALNISLGKPESLLDRPAQRWKNMAMMALGQKKMFDRPIPALLHLCIYVGFVVVNLELLEIVLDGILGTHRIFLPIFGTVYNTGILIFEFFAIAVIVSCVVFLWRRNVLKVARFRGKELNAFPFLDANIILVVEFILMCAFLQMNAIDQVLQSQDEHASASLYFFFSSFLMPLYTGMDASSLHFLERASWWVHILGIFAFLNYLPYSKHLHIILAFPNTYFARLSPLGQLSAMPLVTHEVKLMLQLPTDQAGSATGRFGAKDVQDLSWKSLLDAYTCTECGRCTSVCPANLTGKLLSPRKIMMDTRDRLQEVGNNIEKHGSEYTDNKSLLGDYIRTEELLACTTCNACSDACPVSINPVEIIVQLRRYKVMEESQAPQSWNMMFQNVETSMAPWKFAPSDRFNWAEKV